MSLLVFAAKAQAQDLNKNTAAANLELIELLGGLDDSGGDNADDLEALDDAIQGTEMKNMTKKPTITKDAITQNMILKDKSHPVGGEK